MGYKCREISALIYNISISAFKYSEKIDSIINFQAILQENHNCYALNVTARLAIRWKTAINRPARISAKSARNYRGKNLHSVERNLHFPRWQTRRRKSRRCDAIEEVSRWKPAWRFHGRGCCFNFFLFSRCDVRENTHGEIDLLSVSHVYAISIRYCYAIRNFSAHLGPRHARYCYL